MEYCEDGEKVDADQASIYFYLKLKGKESGSSLLMEGDLDDDGFVSRVSVDGGVEDLDELLREIGDQVISQCDTVVSGDGDGDSTPTPTTTAKPRVYIWTDSSEENANNTAQVAWISYDAQTCTFSSTQSGLSVASPGTSGKTESHLVTADADFTISCSNGKGESAIATASVESITGASSAAAIVSLTSSHEDGKAKEGDMVTVHWMGTNVTANKYCMIMSGSNALKEVQNIQNMAYSSLPSEYKEYGSSTHGLYYLSGASSIDTTGITFKMGGESVKIYAQCEGLDRNKTTTSIEITPE